jgi:hypothetical protein
VPVDPEVIVDFVFEDGLLFVAVRNIGMRPAYRVSTRFDKPFHGLHGSREVSALRLFRNIEFLAPGREIRAFVDTSAAYFHRREPTKLTAEVAYRTASGERHVHTIRHDLGIYRELAYVEREVHG